MKAILVKIACLAVAVFFVQAMLLSSVCINTKGFSATKEKVLISLDVCGHGGPAGVLSLTDFDVTIPSMPQICITEKTCFPPTPGEVVASADPGETGKPPEPSLS